MIGLSSRSILATLFVCIPSAPASSACVLVNRFLKRLNSLPFMIYPRYIMFSGLASLFFGVPKINLRANLFSGWLGLREGRSGHSGLAYG